MQAELYLITCLNFQVSLTLVTGVGLAQISLAQLNSATPRARDRCRNGGRISHTSPVIANFLLEFSNIHYHGNWG